MKNFVSQITTAILQACKKVLGTTPTPWTRDEWRLHYSLYRFSRLHKPWKRY